MVETSGGRSAVPVGRVVEAAQVCLSRPSLLLGTIVCRSRGACSPGALPGARGEGG